jgi:hypothetical protein
MQYICFVQTQPSPSEGPHAQEVSQQELMEEALAFRKENPGMRLQMSFDSKTFFPDVGVYLHHDLPAEPILKGL